MAAVHSNGSLTNEALKACDSERDGNISLLNLDALSHVLSFISQKELVRKVIKVNKFLNAAVYHSNAWNYVRLSSRQLFKCKQDKIFSHMTKTAWTNLSKFAFMNYKQRLTEKQKQTLSSRMQFVLNASYDSLKSVQLHGVDISLFNEAGNDMKKLKNLEVLWVVTPKRDYVIRQNVWKSLISSQRLVTLEFMSNFALNLEEIKELKCAFQQTTNQNGQKLKNLKLCIESDIECNRECAKLIALLSSSLEIVYITGFKFINNELIHIADSLCKCKELIVLNLMYRNRHNVSDLYTFNDCYNLLYALSISLTKLKVFSLEYGPMRDYEWFERYKQHIEAYFKSLIWAKIGQNTILNQSAVISPNFKCNSFCLSWNANA